MSKKESSAKMATVAGRIMAIAREGGPLKAQAVKDIGASPGVIEQIEAQLRPYIDDAESLAASVLSQREKKKK